MLKRRSKYDEPESDKDHRCRSVTVMGKLRNKLRRNRSNGLTIDSEKDFSHPSKSSTLPARVRPASVKGSSENGVKDSKTRTLYWMEGYLNPLEQSLRHSPGVTRKDSDESVDSGFEQTPKVEGGSETESNSSPAQQSKSLPLSPSLCHDGSEATPCLSHDASSHEEGIDSSYHHEEPAYQLVPSNSMYDKAAFDKAFGPMKDIGRWYSNYSNRQQLQEGGRDEVIPRREKRLPNIPLDDEEEECGPAVPVRVSSISVLEDYEQRLISRPLPPIPGEKREPDAARTHRDHSNGSNRNSTVQLAASHPPIRPRPKPRVARSVACDDSDTYELVEHQMRGSNPLTLGLRNIAKYGWYWGPITRVEAEEKLQGTDDGTFLVRDSSDDRYLLSLSFRSQNKTLHTRIEYSNGYFSFYSFPDSDSEGYRSVVDLIEWSVEHSRAGIFCFSRGKAMGSPAVPVRLLKPLSRFNQVRSLQHYCRFVIRQSIRFDCIRQLPLPRHVHGFLEQSQF